MGVEYQSPTGMKQARRPGEVESLVVRLTGVSDMGILSFSAGRCARRHGDCYACCTRMARLVF